MTNFSELSAHSEEIIAQIIRVCKLFKMNVEKKIKTHVLEPPHVSIVVFVVVVYKKTIIKNISIYKFHQKCVDIFSHNKNIIFCIIDH